MSEIINSIFVILIISLFLYWGFSPRLIEVGRTSTWSCAGHIYEGAILDALINGADGTCGWHSLGFGYAINYFGATNKNFVADYSENKNKT